MRTRKVIAALMAALALSSVAATAQPQSVTSNVEARTKKPRRSRKSSRKGRKSRRRTGRKRRSRKRTNRRRTNKKRVKKVNKKKSARKRPTKRVIRVPRKTANWWDNLPDINFDTNAPLATQMERALQLQGRERDVADYAIMKEEGLTENGQPTISRSSLENQMAKMVGADQQIGHEILGN